MKMGFFFAFRKEQSPQNKGELKIGGEQYDMRFLY